MAAEGWTRNVIWSAEFMTPGEATRGPPTFPGAGRAASAPGPPHSGSRIAHEGRPGLRRCAREGPRAHARAGWLRGWGRASCPMRQAPVVPSWAVRSDGGLLACRLQRGVGMAVMTEASAAIAAPRVPTRRKSRLPAQILRWGLVVAVLGLATVAGWRYSHSQASPVVRYQTGAVDRGPIAA